MRLRRRCSGSASSTRGAGGGAGRASPRSGSRSARAVRRGRRWSMAGAGAAGARGSSCSAPRSGFRHDRRRPRRARSAAGRESEHVVLHYPQGERARRRSSARCRDLEFRHARLAAFLGGAPPGKVTVWWYAHRRRRSRRWSARRHTQFAKPWRREVHVNGGAFPHPVLKHELVHAMAAPFGAPALRRDGAPAGALAARRRHRGPRGGRRRPGRRADAARVGGGDEAAEAAARRARAARARGLLRGARHRAPTPRPAPSCAGWARPTAARSCARSTATATSRASTASRCAALATEWEAFLDACRSTPQAVNAGLRAASAAAASSSAPARARWRGSPTRRASWPSATRAARAALYERCRDCSPTSPATCCREARAAAGGRKPDEARALLEALQRRAGRAAAGARRPRWRWPGRPRARRGDDEAARVSLERVVEPRAQPGDGAHRPGEPAGLERPTPAPRCGPTSRRESDEVKLAGRCFDALRADHAFVPT